MVSVIWKLWVSSLFALQIPIVYSAALGRAEIKQASAVIWKQVLAFGKSEKLEFINIGIFAASSAGRKGRRHIVKFTPDRERSHVCVVVAVVVVSSSCRWNHISVVISKFILKRTSLIYVDTYPTSWMCRLICVFTESILLYGVCCALAEPCFNI